MAKGIAIPPRISGGRLVLSEGAAENEKIVKLAASDGDNINPFNDVGIDHPIFDSNTATVAAQVRSELKQNLRGLQADGRINLLSARPEIDEATQRLLISYEDLEARQKNEISMEVE